MRISVKANLSGTPQQFTEGRITGEVSAQDQRIDELEAEVERLVFEVRRLDVEARIWKKFADEWAADRCMCEYMPVNERPCGYHKALLDYEAAARKLLTGT